MRGGGRPEHKWRLTRPMVVTVSIKPSPSEHLERWLEWRDQTKRPVPGYVEEELRGYLECGMLCFGFGRALCAGCGQGFFIVFSCKGRGVCPSCNGRHMAQTAAHLVDRVILPVPVRHLVIGRPKRLAVRSRNAGVRPLIPRKSGTGGFPTRAAYSYPAHARHAAR